MERWALLWSQLPPQSRCKSDAGGWTATEYMLRSIEYHARVLAWQNTKEAQKGTGQPQPVKSPAEYAEGERHRDEALAHRREISGMFNINLD